VDWPTAAAQDRYTGPWNRPTASTILVVGNTGDPWTAYQDSVAMSRELAHARLLTVDGYGHTTGENPSTCTINDLVGYTITGALPAPGTVQPRGRGFPSVDVKESANPRALPIGYLEQDESAIDDAVREASEEAGPNDVTFVHVVHHRAPGSGGRLTFFCFTTPVAPWPPQK
jgi:TAP-like protein